MPNRPPKKRKGKHQRGRSPWKGRGGGAPPSNGARECMRRLDQLAIGAAKDDGHVRGRSANAILRACNCGVVLLASERKVS